MIPFPVRICAAVLFLASISTAAPAQLQPSVTISAAGLWNDGENAVTEDFEPIFHVELEDTEGAGIAVVLPFTTRLGVELAAFYFDPEATFRISDPRNLGPITMIPLTASLLAEVPIGRSFAAELTAGAAFVIFDEFEEYTIGPENLELTDEWTWTAGAAIRWDAARRISVVAGAKYLPLEPEFTAVDRDPLPLDTSFLIGSAGVRLRF